MKPEEVVQRQLDAYNARDIDVFLSCFAPDVVMFNGEGEVMLQGIEEVQQRYARLFEQSPHLKSVISYRTVIGDYIIDEEEITGYGLEGYPPNFRLVLVFRIVDEKIFRVTVLQ